MKNQTSGTIAVVIVFLLAVAVAGGVIFAMTQLNQLNQIFHP